MSSSVKSIIACCWGSSCFSCQLWSPPPRQSPSAATRALHSTLTTLAVRQRRGRWRRSGWSCARTPWWGWMQDIPPFLIMEVRVDKKKHCCEASKTCPGYVYQIMHRNELALRGNKNISNISILFLFLPRSLVPHSILFLILLVCVCVLDFAWHKVLHTQTLMLTKRIFSTSCCSLVWQLMTKVEHYFHNYFLIFLFHFFFSLLSLFLIIQLFESKKLFCRSSLQRHKPGLFWSSLVGILDFTGSTALQAVRHVRRIGIAGGLVLQAVSKCPWCH